ncbi:MAG: carboxymuconolactone decarboxylase family protein [Pseudomonadota bacterium]
MKTLEEGRALSERLNPGMEAALDARYGDLLPGMAEAITDFAWGRVYARPALDQKTRFLITVAALAAQGGQTRPQLKVNVAAARRAGASREEIAEAIWQMSLYGGLPAAINGLNAALEVFSEEDEGDGTDDAGS